MAAFTIHILPLLEACVSSCFMVLLKLQDMLGPEQVQNYDGLYGQGPPSVHSSHGGRQYQQPGKSSTLQLEHYAHVALFMSNWDEQS